ncbi:MAG TPA: SRPBCC family protein [Acidimicrobiia bacterium]
MSLNEITVDAPPQAVWDVLADPPTYEYWVVGNKAIRSYDPGWPAPGTEFRHKVGFGPVTVKDTTVSLEAEPPRRLVMRVRALPVGKGIVTFELDPIRSGSATVVRMGEQIDAGPARFLAPAFDPLTHLRNAETLRRLRRLAEQRYRAGGAGGAGSASPGRAGDSGHDADRG